MLPPLTLRYLQELTDDTGLLQHAKYSVPDRREGYSTDDNARALIVVSEYFELRRDRNALRLARIYLSFLHYMQLDNGSFYNKLSYDRLKRWDLSEDCYGRAMWGCGTLYASKMPLDLRRCAKEMFNLGLRNIRNLKAPRAIAFTILGLYEYWKKSRDSQVLDLIRKLAWYLVELYQVTADDDWKWFENIITYENARLPQALFIAYMVTRNREFKDVAIQSFKFLKELMVVNGMFWPIGNKGWYHRGGIRALYDQQPVEAGCMVEASLTGFEATRESDYLKTAIIAFEWYLGRNSLGVKVYNERSGACYDGITPRGLNYNMGAEATLSYLMARIRLEKLGLRRDLYAKYRRLPLRAR